MLVPHRLEIGGKTFVEPDVSPGAAGQVIAKPLMRQLVRFQTVAGIVQLGAGIVNHVVGLRGGADVLHAATEVTSHRLRVFCIRVLQTCLFGKELDHLRQPRRGDFSFFKLIWINIGLHRNARVFTGDGLVFAHDH